MLNFLSSKEIYKLCSLFSEILYWVNLNCYTFVHVTFFISLITLALWGLVICLQVNSSTKHKMKLLGCYSIAIEWTPKYQNFVQYLSVIYNNFVIIFTSGKSSGSIQIMLSSGLSVLSSATSLMISKNS